MPRLPRFEYAGPRRIGARARRPRAARWPRHGVARGGPEPGRMRVPPCPESARSEGVASSMSLSRPRAPTASKVASIITQSLRFAPACSQPMGSRCGRSRLTTSNRICPCQQWQVDTPHDSGIAARGLAIAMAPRSRAGRRTLSCTGTWFRSLRRSGPRLRLLNLEVGRAHSVRRAWCPVPDAP